MVLVFMAVLIFFSVAAYTDIKTKMIPDWIPLCIVLVGCTKNLWLQYDWIPSVISGGIVLLSFIVVIAIENAIKVNGIGGGDIKLMVSTAFTLGIYPTAIILLIACIGSAVHITLKKHWLQVSYREVRIPMAPYFLIGYITYLILK